MQQMFADGIFNIGRMKVWFYVSQSVYEKIPAHEREQCHELLMEWFSVFETKCPVIHVEHMRNKWDEIRRCCNVLNWNINTYTNLSMISPCRTIERDTVKPIYLCVECEREFYAKEHLFRHSLVHKACVYCGKTSPKHKCHKTTSTTLTKKEALKPYLNCFHYKMYSKVISVSQETEMRSSKLGTGSGKAAIFHHPPPKGSK